MRALAWLRRLKRATCGSAFMESRRGRVLDGLVLAVLLVCVVAAERYDDALAALDSLAAAGSQDDQASRAAPDWFGAARYVVTGLGTATGLWVACRIQTIAAERGAKHAGGDRVDDDARERRQRRVARVMALSITAVAAWAAWMISGWDVVRDADVAWLADVRPALHVLAIVAAGLAVAGAGGEVVGGARRAWDRASVVRIQLIVLGVVFGAVFLLPTTSRQSIDVLRAWGDGSVARAAAGVAGALLLGAVCRASAQQLLTPLTRWTPEAGEALTRTRLLTVLGLAAVVVGAAWVAIGLVVAAVVGTVVLVAGLTEWTAPRALDADDEESLRRLAGTLGVIPLGTVLAGLTAATVDSWLLVSDAGGADRKLVVYTALVAVLFGILAGYAQPLPAATLRSGSKAQARPARAPRAVTGLIGAAGFGAPVAMAAAGNTGDAVAALVLLGVAVVVAFDVVGEHGELQLVGGACVAAGVGVGVYLDPVGTPRALGTFGVLLIGVAGILLLLHVAGSLAARRQPRAPLQRILPAYVPLVTLIGAWIALAWFQAAATVHQVQAIPRERPPAELDRAVSGWLDRESRQTAGRGAPAHVPMLLVAASGGGSKAAYWTDLVLDCIAGDGVPPIGREEKPPGNLPRGEAKHECGRSERAPARASRLFLTSSVSGGSVGVHHLVRHFAAMTDGTPWVDAAAGAEVLSPIAAWGLFHDLPAFMLGLRTDPRRCDDRFSCAVHADRAMVQEAAVAAFDDGIVPPPGGGLLGAPSPGPITVFNGALDGADARVLISPLVLAPRRLPDPGCPIPDTGEPAAGSVDAHAVLAGQTVRLSTAALLSARFPVVAPAARLGDTQADAPDDCVPPPVLPPIRVRDGGYVENSGVLTLTELLPTIAQAAEEWNAQRQRAAAAADPVVVDFIVVSIDDDPAVIEGDGELREAPRDPFGISKQAGPGYLTRLARDRLEACLYPRVTYLRISPQPHVGARAATGWEVSETVRREDLAAALAAGQARRSVDRVRQILDGRPDPRACR